MIETQWRTNATPRNQFISQTASIGELVRVLPADSICTKTSTEEAPRLMNIHLVSGNSSLRMPRFSFLDSKGHGQAHYNSLHNLTQRASLTHPILPLPRLRTN